MKDEDVEVLLDNNLILRDANEFVALFLPLVFYLSISSVFFTSLHLFSFPSFLFLFISSLYLLMLYLLSPSLLRVLF